MSYGVSQANRMLLRVLEPIQTITGLPISKLENLLGTNRYGGWIGLAITLVLATLAVISFIGFIQVFRVAFEGEPQGDQVVVPMSGADHVFLQIFIIVALIGAVGAVVGSFVNRY